MKVYGVGPNDYVPVGDVAIGLIIDPLSRGTLPLNYHLCLKSTCAIMRFMVSTSKKETEMRTSETFEERAKLEAREERRKEIRRSKSKWMGDTVLREAYIEGIIPFTAFMDGSIEIDKVQSKWIRENRTDAN